jgi:ferrous iron transport protein B
LARNEYRRSSQNSGTEAANKVILVGSPNVGKSLIFNRLSGAYVTVSNYPGTTVEVTRARARLDGAEYELLDTPGMYSMMPLTEEERVARAILLSQKPVAVLQVVDARDIERMLPLTFQLIEAGLPLILDLNMMDEAEKAGLRLDAERLEAELGIPVVTTVATTGHGVTALKRKLAEYLNQNEPHTDL